MHGLQTSTLSCPYCGEQIDIAVDCSIERQTYVEDCGVCCRPITLTVVTQDGEVETIDARTDAE